MIKPMLCATGKPEDIDRYDPDIWAAEVKMDGWRILAAKDNGHVKITAGRNGSNYSGKTPYIEEALLDVLPDGTIVDGELIMRGSTNAVGSGDIGSALSRNGIHHADDLTLVIFDLPRAADHDLMRMPWRDRRRLVEKIALPSAALQITMLCEPTEEAFLQALEDGYEGLVLKRKDSSYVPKRSNAWVKFKAVRTIDCPIINLPHDGEGSFTGLVGAAEFQMPNGQTGRASGMTMAVREEMTYHPERYLGRMAEFAYQSVTDDGRFRHPRFKRMREDLDD
jgi:bifunctional non-homologous end joining protein LigD